MNMLRAGVVLLLASTSGCAALNQKPIIEDRFKSTTADTSVVPRVSIAASARNPPADESKVAITQLSDRGQAALITANAGKPPVELSDGGADKTPRVVVHASTKRRIVLAIRPDAFLGPGDRIDAIRVQLEVVNSQGDGWKFLSWDLAANTETSIDVGKLSIVDANKFTAETGVSLGNSLSDTKLGYEASRTKTQEAEVKDQTRISAAIDETGHAWIDGQAGWRKDLTGNLVLDATIGVSPILLPGAGFVSVSPLEKPGAKEGGTPVPTPAAEVIISELDVYGTGHPLEPICARASLDYRVRHIAKGRDTFSESDDEITSESGHSEARFILAPPRLEPAYGIRVGDKILEYALSDGRVKGVRFQTLQEAVLFADWLKKAAPPSGAAMSNGTIGVEAGIGIMRPLTRADYRSLMAGLLNVEEVVAAQQKLVMGCAVAPKP